MVKNEKNKIRLNPPQKKNSRESPKNVQSVAEKKFIRRNAHHQLPHPIAPQVINGWSTPNDHFYFKEVFGNVEQMTIA